MREKFKELELTLEGQNYQNVVSHVRYPLYADKFEEEISGVPTNRDSFGLIKNRYYLKVLYGWDEKRKGIGKEESIFGDWIYL